jgi:hypothetical protein
MITELTGQDLPQWMAAAREAGLPGISSFAKGLEQDLDAATNGLTMNWSSGPVEGRVNLKDDQAPDVRKGRTPAAPQARLAHCTQLAARTFTKLGPDPSIQPSPTDPPRAFAVTNGMTCSLAVGRSGVRDTGGCHASTVRPGEAGSRLWDP